MATLVRISWDTAKITSSSLYYFPTMVKIGESFWIKMY
jgi:hypothetical protein